MKQEKYNEKSIQVLEGLEAVRKRPGMYIGNVDIKGLHHLIWEIVDNSIDEVLAGFANKIIVILNEDDSISVFDNGRGIPIEIHPKTKISSLETVFTILHAGGKFGGENSGYKVSGGLHGVGASVVNALSKKVKINVFKDGREHELIFENGGKKSSGLKEIGLTNKRGTEITFLPDFSLFNPNVNKFDFDIIINRLREMAFLNKNLKIIVENKKETEDDEKQKFHFNFKNGLIDYLGYLNKDSERINQKVVYAEDQKQDISVEIAMQYVNRYQPKLLSYVNNIATIEGGTHEQGFYDALLRIINNYVKNHVNKKEQEIFTKEDIKEGLVTIISVKHPNPMYEGQTKNKFANLETRKIVNDIFSKSFEPFLLENPDEAKNIITKIKLAAKSRLAAMKAKELTRRKDYLEFSTLPGKLADCASKVVDDTELFIVEGDSAGGSAKMGRDREIQAILPLKGKVINAERERQDRLLANTEILSLITAIGTNIGENFNFDGLRYGKIIIMTDADVDGSHIRILLLTFFYRYLKPIIMNKNLYIAQPPLYKIWQGSKKPKYVYTEEQKNKFLKKINIEKGKIQIQRYKGLGEMSDVQLWETTMNPENRSLLRVTIEDAREADKIVSDLMGEVVEPRKEFIKKNARYAKLDV